MSAVLCCDTDRVFSTHTNRNLKELEHNLLPPLVYQLFLLCSKSTVSTERKAEVIRMVMDHFNYLDAQIEAIKSSHDRGVQTRLLAMTVGTVLMHFSFSVKQDLVSCVWLFGQVRAC